MERVKLDNKRILFNLLPAHVAQHFLMSNPRNMVSLRPGRHLLSVTSPAGFRGGGGVAAGPSWGSDPEGASCYLCLRLRRVALSKPSAARRSRGPLCAALRTG